MSNEELTFVEKSVLLILMAEGKEVANVVLTKDHRTDLKKASREKLADEGLIAVDQKARRYYLRLTEDGFKRALEEVGGAAPSGASGGGGALYAMLARINRYLTSENVSLEEFFGRGVASGAVITPASIEASVRESYARLARKPGDWVKLADLRDAIGELPREAVDAVLVVLNRTATVNIVSDSNQKSLSKRERDAAVIIGNQEKHVIAIGA